MMDKIAEHANDWVDWVGGDEGSGLCIDESRFAKKGKHSFGVARQWNGRLGKTDNCRVGVFGALGKGQHVSLIDARLYLPEAWTGDPKRCAKTGIPHQDRVHKTKPELAMEIVEKARSNGVRFEWVGMDAVYGSSLNLLQGLDAHGETFVADVRKNRHIYLEDPAPYVPASTPGKRRPRCRLRSDKKPVEVGPVCQHPSQQHLIGSICNIQGAYGVNRCLIPTKLSPTRALRSVHDAALA